MSCFSSKSPIKRSFYHDRRPKPNLSNIIFSSPSQSDSEPEHQSSPMAPNLHLKRHGTSSLFSCSHLLNRHDSSITVDEKSILSSGFLIDGHLHGCSSPGRTGFSSVFADRTNDRKSSYESYSNNVPLPLPSPSSVFERTSIVGYPLPLPLPCTSERASKMEQNSTALYERDQNNRSGTVDVAMAISSSPSTTQQQMASAMEASLSSEEVELQPLPLPTCKDLLCASRLKHFRYEELSDACHNFSPASCVDDADLCFMGTLKSHGRSCKPQDIVIVRIPETWQQQRFQEWAVEMSSFHEDHLCKLLGFFGEGQSSEYMLVYEKLQKGSLNRLLFDPLDAPPLDWPTRVKIAYGAAKGLASLHERWPEQVLYWDFRASSVQVDMDYTSKLCGYRFVNTLDSSTYMSSLDPKANPRLFAYQAPETATRGLVTLKSNVWSFGVFLVELLTGKQNMHGMGRTDEKCDLVNWAKPFLADERRLFLVMDTKLQGQFPLQGVKIIAELALQCLDTDPVRRPGMKQVLNTLKATQGMRYTTWYGLQEPVTSDKFVSTHHNTINDHRKSSSFKNENNLSPLNMLGNSNGVATYRKSVSCGVDYNSSIQFRNRAPAGVSPLIIPGRTCLSTFAVETMNVKHQRQCHGLSPSPLPLPLPS